MIQRLPQPFNDYNDTESYNPPKTHEPRRRIGLQRGSLYDGTAESPYFKRFSGIEKAHRNSIKITVDLWQRMRDSNPRKRSQSPVCYRYTNPLFGTDNIISSFSCLSIAEMIYVNVHNLSGIYRAAIAIR